jgi:uncharacterized protein (TIGR02646 family)
MRPVRRGDSPQADDFEPYASALPFLVSRMGNYCSYCERRVQVGLAVEHVQPKGLAPYAHLIGRWSNYLLGCTNCNSTKKDKDVQFDQVLIPDRDNTFAAFDYLQDGTIHVSTLAIQNGLQQICTQTLALTGLDKVPRPAMDENEKIIALDRVRQRKEAWLSAQIALNYLADSPDPTQLRELTVQLALAVGFFSIWMKAFESDRDMRLRLIAAFDGTSASECFDADGLSIHPAPNPDQLAHGGKI